MYRFLVTFFAVLATLTQSLEIKNGTFITKLNHNDINSPLFNMVNYIIKALFLLTKTIIFHQSFSDIQFHDWISHRWRTLLHLHQRRRRNFFNKMNRKRFNGRKHCARKSRNPFHIWSSILWKQFTRWVCYSDQIDLEISVSQ